MGDFTLGCLLGQYDKAQSFDVDSAVIGTGVNSWLANTGATSRYFQSSQVHSSGQGFNIVVYSHTSANVGICQYDYGQANDAHARWFPDVTTHQTQLHTWIRQPTAANSGRLSVRLWKNGTNFTIYTIGRIGPLDYITVSAQVHSGSSLAPAVQFRKGDNPDEATGSIQLQIDDVLLETDRTVLNPEYSFRERARTIKSQQRTRAGDLHTYIWGKYFAWDVPLRYVTDSHAALINWWWENQFNLAFTLDTSDSESIYIARIVNDRQPIGGRIKPYNDLWEGMLRLESINNGSLVF